MDSTSHKQKNSSPPQTLAAAFLRGLTKMHEARAFVEEHAAAESSTRDHSVLQTCREMEREKQQLRSLLAPPLPDRVAAQLLEIALRVHGLWHDEKPPAPLVRYAEYFPRPRVRRLVDALLPEDRAEMLRKALELLRTEAPEWAPRGQSRRRWLASRRRTPRRAEQSRG